MNLRRIFIYNLLNALQVFLGLISQILLARIFGASVATDAYFLSVAVIGFISVIGQFFTEMFMQYYNDIRVKDSSEAKIFYNAVFNFSLFIGLIMFIVSVLGAEPILKIFASGFDMDRIRATKSFFIIVAISLIWTRGMVLNNCLINAELRFLFPYLIGILPPAFNIFFLLFLARRYGINVIALSILLSGFIGFIGQGIYIKKILKISWSKNFWHPEFPKLIRKSFSMQVGHQIWNLKDIITTNLLSHFPVGSVSLYYYALKIITILFTITNSPLLQIYSAKVSRFVSEHKLGETISLLKKIILKNTLLFLTITIPFIFFLPVIIKTLFGIKFSASDIQTIYYIFLLLIPFHIILSLELPFVNITIALKQSGRVIKIGIRFVIFFFLLSILLIRTIGIYAIPIALTIAQTHNLISYIISVRKSLNNIQWNAEPLVV